MVAHCRPSRQPNSFEHSVTLRREEKGEEKRKENKRGRPQTTDPAKGRRGQQKGPRGGESKNPSRLGKSPMPVSGQGDSHTTLQGYGKQPLPSWRVSELPLDLAPELPDKGQNSKKRVSPKTSKSFKIQYRDNTRNIGKIRG